MAKQLWKRASVVLLHQLKAVPEKEESKALPGDGLSSLSL